MQFDAVDFGYADGGQVLRNISFDVPRKSLTALVGPSGSGKTTVTRLISRFYDVDSGVVRVGGVDVRDLTSADLMSQLSLVFQDVYLFDDTLIANIRLGRPEATDEEVFDVARIAGVAEIVERLPRGGWDTRVGEGGTALSGGERQRVSIARALLKRAPVVLLDEATAALDPENEAHVQRAMQELARESTLLVIAHKLSTVVAADQIIVLGDDGSIVEVGTTKFCSQPVGTTPRSGTSATVRRDGGWWQAEENADRKEDGGGRRRCRQRTSSRRPGR